MPRYDLEYLLERTWKIGSKNKVKEQMEKLRQLHIGEISLEEFKEHFKNDKDRLEMLKEFDIANYWQK